MMILLFVLLLQWIRCFPLLWLGCKHKALSEILFVLFLLTVAEHLKPANLLFISVFAAVTVEVNWWFWCWMEQRSQGEHVWYDCWRFSAIKQMDCTHMGTMCLEIFSTMQRCIPIILWLWKGKECSNLLIIVIFYFLVLLFLFFFLFSLVVMDD